jgi:hypothetical protein
MDSRSMLQEHIVLAEQAKNYAREQIQEGSSQLQNNLYDPAKKNALKKALLDIRAAVAVKEKGIAAKIDKVVHEFEQTVAAGVKFSIGNCYEYALIALYYVLRKKSKINAEIFYLSGGDHVVLVIGRNPNSVPSKPETWGSDACMCDPWSNEVYPAVDYLKRTKNFYQVTTADGAYTNHIEDFNPTKHKFSLHSNLNSTYIRQHTVKANALLIEVFVSLNEQYTAIYNKLANDLTVIAENMERCYGKEDFKVLALKEKITELRSAVSAMKNKFSNYIKNIQNESQTNYLSYKEINKEATKKVQQDVQTLRQIGLMPDKLAEHRCQFSLIIMIMNFFNIKPKSYKDYSTALQRSDEQIAELTQVI